MPLLSPIPERRRGRSWLLMVAVVPALGTATPAFAAPKAAKPRQETPPPPPGPTPDEIAARDARLKTLEELVQAQTATIDSVKSDLAREREERAAADAKARTEVEQSVARDSRTARDQSRAELKQTLDAIPPGVSTVRPGVGVTGFVQADAPFRQSSEGQINGSTGDLLNQDRVYVRRARVRFTLDQPFVAGAFELDGNTVSGPAARIVGGEASLKLPGAAGAPPLVMATIGLFKTPFGFEIIESDRDRPFLERSNAEQALFPGEYDAGVRLSGGWRFLRYSVGLMNGEPIGERTFPGRDPNKAKDLVGRVGVDSPFGEVAGLRGGFSLLNGKGFHRGTAGTKDVVQWRDVNDNRAVDEGELTVLPGTAPTTSFDFKRNAVGGDLGFWLRLPRIGKTSVYGEVYLAQNLDRGPLAYDPPSPDAPKARELGWYVAGVQELGRHVVVAARYDVYNPDRDATESRSGRVFARERTVSTLALTAALVSPYGRLMLEFDRNRNHNGRDVSGAPANLKDNAVILRGQVNF